MLWQPTSTTKRDNALRGPVASNIRFAENDKASLGSKQAAAMRL